jgi:hypothetical protein
MKIPRYINLDQARQVLFEMGVDVTDRQIKRAAEPDAAGKRKLPFFVDPIDGRLKIEKNALMQAYFNRQAEAENNLKEPL